MNTDITTLQVFPACVATGCDEKAVYRGGLLGVCRMHAPKLFGMEDHPAFARSLRAKINTFVRAAHVQHARDLGTHTDEEWLALCSIYEFRCLRCLAVRDFSTLTRDHVIPVSNGGSDAIDNIQPLCGSCNASKGVGSEDYRATFLDRLRSATHG